MWQRPLLQVFFFVGPTGRYVIRDILPLRSMGEVCDGMRALAGKLNYPGLDSSPSKSTAEDALRDRDNEIFKLYYFALIKYFDPLLSVSRKEKISFEKFYAFDSTTITLFSDVIKGVGRNPKGDGKQKGGSKVHMLTDVHADTAVFAKISEAKMHDKKFLQHLNPSKRQHVGLRQGI